MAVKQRKKKWPARNLEELICFLEEQYPDGKFSVADIASRIGDSKSAVSCMFLRDDMKLSKAEHIASCYGYTLSIFFPEYERESEFIRPLNKKVRCYEGKGNLKGLADYIRDGRLSVSEIAKKIDKDRNVLIKAFATGDIQISTLYLIVDTLGKYIVWRFNKN